jgi:hypothetical protein
MGVPAGDLTVHHLFPRRLLATRGYDAEVANTPANYALLSRATNSEFGDKRPDEVFEGLSPEQRKSAAAQFFGEAAGDRLRPERFREFCDWRAKRLAEALNEYMGVGD